MKLLPFFSEQVLISQRRRESTLFNNKIYLIEILSLFRTIIYLNGEINFAVV